MLEHIKKAICYCLVVTYRLECYLFTDTMLLPEPDAKVMHSWSEGGIRDRKSCIENLMFLEGLSGLLGHRMNGIEKCYLSLIGGTSGIVGDGKIVRRAYEPCFA